MPPHKRGSVSKAAHPPVPSAEAEIGPGGDLNQVREATAKRANERGVQPTTAAMPQRTEAKSVSPAATPHAKRGKPSGEDDVLLAETVAHETQDTTAEANTSAASMTMAEAIDLPAADYQPCTI